MSKAAIRPQSLVIGRDESWMAFNRRVLEEAQDASNPLLERVKFLAITASNLDEFVEIRVAGVLQRIEDGYKEARPDGFTPQESLDKLSENVHTFVCDQYRCWNGQLRPQLNAAGVRVLKWEDLDAPARAHVAQFYQNEVDPLLTPITLDPAHPFPRVINKALCLALLLKRKRRGAGAQNSLLGVVTVPRALPRLISVPSSVGTHDFIFLHDLIEQNAASMYRGYEILSKAAFRVTRNSNLYFEEEEARDLLETVRSELHNRRKGDAVRLEIEDSADPEIIDRLRVNFELEDSQVFRTDGPVNLSRLMNLYTDTDRVDLKFKPFVPREMRLSRRATDLFDDLRNRDILLHHPFDAYDGVVQFIQSAAADPRVLSIKQTLYRTSSDSPIFQALVDAAQNKEVTVVVELMARFDEASNIRWARNLEDAGVQVFHGILGLKTHCKLALLVRHDEDGVTRSYAHLGTGNYNPSTARFYTDISLLTSDPEITRSAHNVFRYLTAHSETDDYKPLLVSPLTLAETFIRMIHRETDHAAAGRPAHIIAKMNALLEPSVVDALYAASHAGVQIDLIVRGMCALRPGIKGLSENIRVRSIVGRFLEHSRIFYFQNGGDEEVYCGSADWLARNFFERCEVVFPIKDPHLRTRLREEILAAFLADNVKARLEAPDGSYYYAKSVEPFKSAPPFDAQAFLMQLAEGTVAASEIPKPLVAIHVTPPRPAKQAAPSRPPGAKKRTRKAPGPVQSKPIAVDLTEAIQA